MKKILKLYFRTVKLAMKYRWIYLIGLFFSMFLLFFSNYAIFRLKNLVNAIQTGGDIITPLIIIGVVIALPLLLEPATFLPKAYVYAKVMGDLMNILYKRVMSLDYAFHTNKETGKVVSKIMNADTVPLIFFWNFEYWAWENLFSLIIPIVIMVFISREVALLIVLSLLIIVPLQSIAIKYNMKTRYILKEAEYARNSAIIDGVTNYETVRVFARKKDEISYVSKLVSKNIDAVLTYQNSFRLIDFMSRFGGILIFVIGSTGLVYMRESLDAGSIVVVVTYLIQISNKVMSFVFSMREIFKNIPVIEDIYELMDSKSSIDEPEKPEEIADPKGGVEYQDVSFAYNEDNGIISGISMSIPAGETVAFVGPSGGGKSTLVRLLLRYYDVNRGAVLVDGHDIRKLGTDNVNELIGVVPQEPILFNRSLKYNIGYALSPNEEDLDSRMDEIIDACQKAQIFDFIKSLPNGLETVVGERGIKLSGGQKQRVAIARVLLKNPKIIIFDEATSMLDSESEAAIQKAFKELSRGTTTIVIAHRLSTIKNVDRIFVIDKGKLVEQGRHDELVKSKGIYSKLWTLQSGGFTKAQPSLK
ncbi:ABC transporter ATP-binding protein [Candidatus Dojkabacteria bacterium]|nr:ABC transporter ATP-binding protein [Candidatus Dojkabacteria bacterium]